MKILALDLGTTLGWAIGEDDRGVVAWGEESFGVGRFDSYGTRFLRFRNWLKAKIEKAAPDLVAFEAIGFVKFAQAGEVLHGLTAIMAVTLDELGVPYEGVNPGTLKKWATDRGNSKKEAMWHHLKAKWPQVVPRFVLPKKRPGNNAVDAIWVCDWALKRDQQHRSAA